MPIVKLDEMACRACQKNNDRLIALNEKVPLPGGNIDQLKVLVGGQRITECEEYTMVKWTWSPHEIILLNLLDEFENNPKPALIDVRCATVGLSFKSHKTVENIF